MKRFKLIGILLYIAGFLFVAAMIVHYKQGGLTYAIFPIVLGGFSFCMGSVALYVSRNKD